MSQRFKLKYNDLTRSISFPKPPTWKELSERISALFSIPADRVGVTYIDAENEEITLNTEDELRDYYISPPASGGVIKFTVRNLGPRNQRPLANQRNTFGQFVEVDLPGVEDWQTVQIPPLEEILGLASPTEAPHAFGFVEDLSEGSTITREEKIEERPDNGSRGSTPLTSRIDKGKDRELSAFTPVSTQSVVGEDNNGKPPIHVYDVSPDNRKADIHPFSFDTFGNASISSIAAESTPKAQTQNLEEGKKDIPTTEHDKPSEHDDPPLPTFETSTTTSAPSVNLAQDITAFLNTLTTVVSSHPELTETLRNIMRNTTNGTYWNAHRTAISQAAAQFQRNTEALAQEGRRAMEEEAGRRVTAALEGVLRTFSHLSTSFGNGDASGNMPTNTNAENDAPGNTDTPMQTPPIPGQFFPHPPLQSQRRNTWQAHRSFPPRSSFNAVPISSPNAPPMPSASNPETQPIPPPPKESSPKGQTQVPEAQSSPANQEESNLSPQELRARVEEAKRKYRAEKELYRQQKQEWRKERSREHQGGNLSNAPTHQHTATASYARPYPEISQIISNARNGFPQLEMINVSTRHPHRHAHDTYIGNFHSRHASDRSEDLFTRAVTRITKRLSDMGFTEKTYPELPDKIKTLLPRDGAISKDGEDDIVTTLLEELLSSPKSPAASGSGLKGKSVPGSWH